MRKEAGATIGRRELLVRTAPTCAMACLGLEKIPGLAAAIKGGPWQETHKFDVPTEMSVSPRDLMRRQNRNLFGFIETLREEIGDQEVIRLLNIDSEKIGVMQGEAQKQSFPDTSFKTFVAQFRPPNYTEMLTHEVVEDTDDTFELKVTECLIASVFREAGLGGDIGHAAVCNMDYHWPPAFNPSIKMERSKTLMEGHDCCNHRYMKVADR
jgi:hypothetical protein